MKKLLRWAIITSIIIGIVVWIASEIIPFSYSEWSFFIGLGLTVLLFFFNSSGGPLTAGATLQASESVWKIQKEKNQLEVNVGGVFYGAVLYTLVSLISMLIIYF